MVIIVICLLTKTRIDRQELKFKCKSDQWTASESEKKGFYGNIYDFVVDYEQILGVKAIYDMHRYLMTKHNITP